MAISAVVKTWLPAGFVLLAGCVVSAAYYYKRNEKFRFRADSFVLKLPYLGDLQKKSAVGRFARTFGALCAGGVPIAPALEITAATANNSVIEKGLFATLDAIRSGQTIAAPLRQTGVFPPMVVQMIAAGEKSGNLPDMLIRIADYYDTEVDSAIGTLSAVLEPALIVIMGVVVAGVLIAMYLPMFEMISAFG
jgi:type IV pilus assembly protein PilC